MFLTWLTVLLPCSECRQHLTEFIPRLAKGSSAFQMGFELHQMVSSNLRKPTNVNIDDVYAYYTSADAQLKYHKSIWIFLHAIAFQYTQAAQYAFTNTLRMILNGPIPIRIRTAVQNHALRASNLEDSDELFYWTFYLHSHALANGEVLPQFSKFKESYRALLSTECKDCEIR